MFPTPTSLGVETEDRMFLLPSATAVMFYPKQVIIETRRGMTWLNRDNVVTITTEVPDEEKEPEERTYVH